MIKAKPSPWGYGDTKATKEINTNNVNPLFIQEIIDVCNGVNTFDALTALVIAMGIIFRSSQYLNDNEPTIEGDQIFIDVFSDALFKTLETVPNVESLTRLFR